MTERKKAVAKPKEDDSRSKSNAELDLERRTAEGFVPESATKPVTVNPNPYGTGAYVGTDPMYQNSSTDANKAFDSKSGVEKKLNDEHKASFKTSGKTAPDPGMGGEAEVAVSDTSARTFRTLLPGQEGYDADEAEAQKGSPQRVYSDES